MNYTIKQGSTIIAYADNLDEALDAARDYEGGYVVGPQGKVVPDKVHGRVAWSNPTKNPWKRAGEKKLIASSNHWELYQVERSSPSGYGEGSPYYMLVNYKTGTTDYPIVYDDGTVAYDRPEAIPTYVRVMVEREIGKKNYGRVGGPDADRKGNPRLSAGMSPNRFDQKALKMGTKIEMEHTDDPAEARRIAMDHLVEDSNYYKKLRECVENPRRGKAHQAILDAVAANPEWQQFNDLVRDLPHTFHYAKLQQAAWDLNREGLIFFDPVSGLIGPPNSRQREGNPGKNTPRHKHDWEWLGTAGVHSPTKGRVAAGEYRCRICKRRGYFVATPKGLRRVGKQ